MRLSPLIALSVQSLLSDAIVNVAPTVHLDSGLFIGNQSNNIAQFLGIPFAEST